MKDRLDKLECTYTTLQRKCQLLPFFHVSCFKLLLATTIRRSFKTAHRRRRIVEAGILIWPGIALSLDLLAATIVCA